VEQPERLVEGEEPGAVCIASEPLETLPALNRMQPFRNLQLAQAVCLARLLAECDSDRTERRTILLVQGEDRLRTDMLCGSTLLKGMRARNPNPKIILSGYAAEERSLPENEQFAILPKPFRLGQLARRR
jgi:hypothetical protein